MGGVGCEVDAVCAILCVIWEAYVIVCKPDAPDWSCVMQMGAMWCFMGAKFYVEAMLPHMGVM
jgi:hypothetical protein